MMFVDMAKIMIQAGNGGNGAVSFHREKYVAAGGPDGGDGGRGGNVVMVADDNLSTLADFRYKRKYVAQNGENGRSGRSYGKSAPDLIVRVPRGTLVKDVQTGRLIADISDKEPVVLARGGKGGRAVGTRGQGRGTLKGERADLGARKGACRIEIRDRPGRESGRVPGAAGRDETAATRENAGKKQQLTEKRRGDRKCFPLSEQYRSQRYRRCGHSWKGCS